MKHTSQFLGADNNAVIFLVSNAYSNTIDKDYLEAFL